MNTILITGCSSGFGLETARHFAEREWNVVATMRTPNVDVLTPSDRVRVLPLDITNSNSISELVEAAGPIDVLVNNAGVGLLGIVEGTPLDAIRTHFETNTFGTIALTQAFLKQFRERGSGVIVNVSSSTTLKARSLFAVYSASKAAINSFTESLALEMEPFGVRVRLVVPGRSPETPFGHNALVEMQRLGVVIPDAYAEFTQKAFAEITATTDAPVTFASDVADVIWRAVIDPACPVRLPAGADARELAGGAN